MPEPQTTTHSTRTLPLALLALGVVYGDIGTSPLYAIRECFFGEHGVAPTRENVLGVLSLIFWTLIVVVTIKYHVYVIRADNRGEGGILALTALVRGKVRRRARLAVLGLGLFGAALLYADGVLTPAISVLGAIEGLAVDHAGLAPLIVPLSLVILLGLFLLQRRGTAGVGAVFGPVMLVWFSTLAVLGLRGVLRDPSVLAALLPTHALHFLADNGAAAFLVLGAVFLVATGGEALYADLGHFGEKPIQIDWFGLVGASLMLNYLGQGALVLADPQAARNPFYLLAPQPLRPALLVLATAAAIIASQAIISGSFSLTRQAVQLGYLPRLRIVHTSEREIGQIYVPAVNWLLAAAVAAVVIAFESSSHVANAYGVALTTTMLITTMLAAIAARKIWKWPAVAVAAVTVLFLIPDVAFFSSAMIKIPDGGWFPLAAALAILALMSSWQSGRAALGRALVGRLVPVEQVIDDLDRQRIPRVRGTAVYLTGDERGAPIALLHNLKLNRIVHRLNLLVTVRGTDEPYVADAERLDLRELRPGFHRLVARYGFMEEPDVAALIARPEVLSLGVDPEDTLFVLSRNELRPARRPTLAAWRRKLFMFLTRRSLDAEDYFHLPPDLLEEFGMQIEV